MKLLKIKKGFTLIELLVVIAIIGLLSSVVLAALNGARTKGKVSSVKAGFTQVRAQMELQNTVAVAYGDNVNASGCSTATGAFSNSVVQSIIADMTNDGTASIVCTSNNTTGTNDTGWAFSATLPGGGSWCVDSLGTVSATTDTNTDGDCGA